MPKSLDDVISEQAPRDGEVPVTFLPEPIAEELWCPIVSVDDHVLEPITLFDGRLPTRLQSLAPRVEPGPVGHPYWIIDDQRIPIHSGNAAVGRPIAEWKVQAVNYDETRRGVWDVDARISDMDLNGVWASLNFPSMVWGFAGTRFAKMRDAEVGLASLRAYNDWMIEEWCGSHPDRFISCQLAWLGDPHEAAQEIRRNADRGFVSVSFSENPEGQGLPGMVSDHWDPFLRACEETGTVINLHVGSSGNLQRPSEHAPSEAGVAVFPVAGIMAVVDWIFARIPIRFPDLKITLSEAGISWVPMIQERLMRAYRQRESSVVWSATNPDPVDLLRQNFYFTSIEDPSGFRALDLIGEDHVMIETDYPHMDSSWPTSQSLFRGQLQHLSSAVIRKVSFENACRLYRHTPPPAELLAASVIGGATDHSASVDLGRSA